MLSKKEMLDQSENIIHHLEKNEWISSYEIYNQAITRMNSKVMGRNIEKRVTKQDGFAIRLISKSKRMIELSFNHSMINILNNISEPKTTQKILPISEFKELKQPRITSIIGDEGSSFNLRNDFMYDILEEIDESKNDDISLITRTLDLLLEHRLIVTSGSTPIQDVSLKTSYKLTYLKYMNSNIYSATRTVFGRNLSIDYKAIENQARIALTRNMQIRLKFDQSQLKGIVLDPFILGRILTSLTHNYLLGSGDKQSWKWNNNYQLFDDPHRAEGYSSIIFDDEGSLTKSKLIMEYGVIINRLVDYQSTNWNQGGNGFRSSWYQPLLRSYKYPVNRFFTNLSLYGGVGRGKKFLHRSGIVLRVLKGRVSVIGGIKDLKFIIHSSEAQFWKNGDFIGPASNVTISGSINDLFTQGNISSDQHLVVDKSVPGSVYSGWCYLHSGIAIVSWN